MAMVLFASGGRAQNQQVVAKLQPDTAVVGSTVVYLVTMQVTGNGSIPAPQLPPLDPSWGLSSPQYAGQEEMNTNIMIGPNGSSMSRSVTFRYSFTTSKEGTFTIGPSQVQVGGQVFRSNPVTLRVTQVPASANVPSQLQGLIAPPVVQNDPQLSQKLTGAIFVLPVITNPNPYNGEQIRVSFHLCIDAQAIQKAGLSGERLTLADVKTPAMNDFIKEEIFPLPRDVKFREQVIGGRTYQVAPLYEVAISSTKTGKVEIDPFAVQLLFSSRSRRGAFDDDLFSNNPLFSGMDPFFLSGSVPITAQSKTQEINVKPLPTDGKPANFSGAVGDFKVTVTPDRDKLKANEDVLKLTLTIEGKGDASSVKPPALPNIPGVSQLGDPKATTTGRKENDEYITTKKVDYILRPTQPGTLEIPPMQLSAFNPKTQLFENLESNPVQVQVTPGSQPATVLQAPVAAAATPAGGAGGAAPPPQETDLRYIHTGALTFAEPGLLSGEGPLFFGALAIPPVLLAAGYLAGRRRVAPADQRGRRRKRAGETARKHLRQAEKLLNSPDRTNFFAELARSLRTYFGDRFGMEPAGITIEQITGELDAAGSSPETIALADRLLEQCDAARYSPVQPDESVARRAFDEALELINRAERKA
jgi:hypothetical protein